MSNSKMPPPTGAAAQVLENRPAHSVELQRYHGTRPCDICGNGEKFRVHNKSCEHVFCEDCVIEHKVCITGGPPYKCPTFMTWAKGKPTMCVLMCASAQCSIV